MAEENKTEKEKARERLLDILPALRHAMREAKNEGEFRLGVLSVRPDNTGNIVCTLEASTFLDDIALAIDAPPVDEKDDEMEAKAMKILSMFGPRRP